jgi:hypothetical protein
MREGLPHLSCCSSTVQTQPQHHMGLFRTISVINLASKEAVTMYISHNSGSLRLQPPEPLDTFVPGGASAQFECTSAMYMSLAIA